MSSKIPIIHRRGVELLDAELPAGDAQDRPPTDPQPPRRVRLRANREPIAVLLIIFAVLIISREYDARFECQRDKSSESGTSGSCTLTHTYLYASHTEAYDLADVLRLDVEIGEVGKTMIFVQTPDGERKVPLSGDAFYRGFESKREEVQRFNAFLADSSAERAVMLEGSLLLIVPIAFLLGFAGLRVTFGYVRSVDCEVDTDDRSLQIQRRGWIFSRRKSIPLQEISEFEIEGKTALFNSWDRIEEQIRADDVRYRIVLVSTSGERIVLIAALRSFADADGFRREISEMTTPHRTDEPSKASTSD